SIDVTSFKARYCVPPAVPRCKVPRAEALQRTNRNRRHFGPPIHRDREAIDTAHFQRHPVGVSSVEVYAVDLKCPEAPVYRCKAKSAELIEKLEASMIKEAWANKSGNILIIVPAGNCETDAIRIMRQEGLAPTLLWKQSAGFGQGLSRP